MKEFDFCPDGIDECKDCPSYDICRCGPGAYEVDGDLFVNFDEEDL